MADILQKLFTKVCSCITLNDQSWDLIMKMKIEKPSLIK